MYCHASYKESRKWQHVGEATWEVYDRVGRPDRYRIVDPVPTKVLSAIEPQLLPEPNLRAMVRRGAGTAGVQLLLIVVTSITGLGYKFALVGSLRCVHVLQRVCVAKNLQRGRRAMCLSLPNVPDSYSTPP